MLATQSNERSETPAEGGANQLAAKSCEWSDNTLCKPEEANQGEVKRTENPPLLSEPTQISNHTAEK
jgi:hypothetical protein